MWSLCWKVTPGVDLTSSVLVSQNCCNKLPDWMVQNNRNVCSQSSGDQKSKIKLSAGLVLFWRFCGRTYICASLSDSGCWQQCLEFLGLYMHPCNSYFCLHTECLCPCPNPPLLRRTPVNGVRPTLIQSELYYTSKDYFLMRSHLQVWGLGLEHIFLGDTIILTTLSMAFSGRHMLVSQVISPTASAKTMHTSHAVHVCFSGTLHSLESPSASFFLPLFSHYSTGMGLGSGQKPLNRQQLISL